MKRSRERDARSLCGGGRWGGGGAGGGAGRGQRGHLLSRIRPHPTPRKKKETENCVNLQT